MTDRLQSFLKDAEIKSKVLKEQIKPMRNIIEHFCKNKEIIAMDKCGFDNENEYYMLSPDPSSYSKKIMNDLSTYSQYITIHNYLRGKENIVSVNGAKTAYIFKYPKDITAKAMLNALPVYNMLIISKDLYHPSCYLDIIKEDISKSIEYKINVFKENEREIIKSGGSFKKNISRGSRFIVKKDTIKRNNAGVSVKDLYDCIYKLLLTHSKKSYIAVCEFSKNTITRACGSDIWSLSKEIKYELNKLVRKDRFYYEISTTYVLNDFRFKSVKIIDRFSKKCLIILYNNLEYEALPCYPLYENNNRLPFYIMDKLVELRLQLFDELEFMTGDEESRLLISEFRKKISLDECLTLKQFKERKIVTYIGEFSDEKIDKFAMGANMIRFKRNH